MLSLLALVLVTQLSGEPTASGQAHRHRADLRELLAGAGGLALMALTIGTALLPVATIVALALVCAGLGVVGAVVALIGLPALVRAQSGTLELVSSYNHGLARQPLLSIPLGL